MSHKAAAHGMPLLVFRKIEMNEKTTLELPNDVWRILHAMALEHPVARHVAIGAIQMLEHALMKAQQPPTVDKEPEA